MALDIFYLVASFAILIVVELFTWMSFGGCGKFISIRVVLIGTASVVMTKKPHNAAFTADAIRLRTILQIT